ncbi:MAG: 6-carboxytetrahydropterin synthase QueD [Sulfurimonas sp. RIFOXYD12_FULL_33_39]|uniref:6-pyruvoyl trahydropterin synthase family protein n=1 Tax=unclassified Sulfurimonas TaxID=2623549 RepID=UPI0008B56A70|nr:MULTISPECIES: 6-carboxytetrahydropterin synthase [unclassified Sulfurimonas]OHE05813.1 MAG: 6-carboxytetrahydropterin synthase QueD [Sulfurimonas sp. RIFCSPLOWO2_12_FULL_34_6]OHE09793.1 MAG: 6-carboxytetrahydropterin synthase QueD [Sulfurimonas sp. RIFOXYD12_FULL_33_39]OHE13699.1 MAG: 6-carboxytetrahydropterin synthase QueD [Sulfurimonas sp. RIFOXYD2_FULL_34_21]DAB28086.1 MAG TPA: 6-carboxytetrahydropterin synthase QueD [Sulfurimonas sp. UBA10385]
MIIRKMFKFESAHIVRGCSTVKCRSSLHGHSYKVELLFESNFLDNGQMVYDFGLMKQNMKALIESFDHSIAIWSEDSKEYIEDMKKHSSRWVVIPVSPSAEQFSRVIFILIDKLLELTTTVNGEKEVKLNSVIAHETDTGYAQAFREDAYSLNMGLIDLDDIIFSSEVQNSWHDSKLFEKIKNKEKFINPKSV